MSLPVMVMVVPGSNSQPVLPPSGLTASQVPLERVSVMPPLVSTLVSLASLVAAKETFVYSFSFLQSYFSAHIVEQTNVSRSIHMKRSFLFIIVVVTWLQT